MTSAARMEAFEPRTLLAAGPLDPTFGIAGRAVVDLPAANADVGRAAAVDADGKLVVAGTTNSAESGLDQDGVTLVRYGADGSLDPSFGDGGRVRVPDSRSFTTQAMAIDQQGRIVVAFDNFAFARVNHDGSIDRTFGDGGIARTAAPIGGEVRAVVIRPDGRVLAGGLFPAGAVDDDYALVQMNTDGSPDVTFGANGLLRVGGPRDEAVEALRLLPGGAVLAAGVSKGDFVLFRLTPRGQVDRGGFGTKGFATADLGRPGEAARGIAIQPDGRIVLAGVSGGDVGLVRFSAAGVRDGSFGSGGKTRFDLGTANDDVVGVFAVAGGRLVVAGSTATRVEAGNGVGAFAAARFDASGKPDATYGTVGRTVVDVTPGGDVAAAAAVDGNGRLVIVGTNDQYAAEDIIAVRLTAPGAADESFGDGGQVRTNFDSHATFTVTDAVTLPGGKTLVTGVHGGFYPYRTPMILRFNADGTHDAGFGRRGRVGLASDIAFEDGGRLHVLPDGRFVLASAFGVSSIPGFEPERHIVFRRFKADGSADATFGDAGRIVVEDPAGLGNFAFDHHDRILVNDKRTVTRYTAAGALDATFGVGGRATAGQGPDVVPRSAADLAVMGDDGVLLLFNGSDGVGAVARLTAAGKLDAAFGAGGFVRHDVPADELRRLVARPGGRFLIVGARARRRPRGRATSWSWGLTRAARPTRRSAPAGGRRSTSAGGTCSPKPCPRPTGRSCCQARPTSARSGHTRSSRGCWRAASPT